jgi:hypothetical protein
MTDWKLRPREHDSLPKLAWLAEVEPGARIATVHHGSAVESRPHWCVEGTWEAPFEDGDFHRVENFFGSGVRIDGERLVFAGSVALVDRLFHLSWNGRLLVSNSLVQLLARTGARLNARHNYRAESFASGQGIKSYPSAFRVLHPDFRRIFQEYHCNLVVTGSGVERELRSRPRRFSSFEEYSAALHGTLAAIRDNYRSSTRRHRMDAFATTSSGYDSTAATVLASGVGVAETFTTALAPGADVREQDSGAAVANHLGLTVRSLSSNRDRASALERYLLAATVEGSEIFLENLAHYIATNCDAAVVYTGYHGDVVWKRPPGSPEAIDDMRRKDVSGLNLSEARLAAGFVHLAVPFLYARNMADITAISRSSEMQPWSVSGDYDRPIPRRIVESAGVPRDLFGQVKRVQVRFYGDPRDPILRDEFNEFLGTKAGIPPSQLRLIEGLHSVDHAAMRVARGALKLGETPSLMQLLAPNLFERRSLVFVWAANSLASRFASVYADREAARA